MTPIPLSFDGLACVTITQSRESTPFDRPRATAKIIVHVTPENMQGIADWLASLGVRASDG